MGAVVYGVIMVIIYFMTRKSNKAYAGETMMYRIKCYVKEVSLSKRGYGGLFLYYDFLQKKYVFKTIVGISSSIKEITFAEFSATEDGNKLKVMELKKPE